MKDEHYTWLGIGLGALVMLGVVTKDKVKGFLGIGKNEVRSAYDWKNIDGGFYTERDGIKPAKYPVPQMMAKAQKKTARNK